MTLFTLGLQPLWRFLLLLNELMKRPEGFSTREFMLLLNQQLAFNPFLSENMCISRTLESLILLCVHSPVAPFCKVMCFQRLTLFNPQNSFYNQLDVLVGGWSSS